MALSPFTHTRSSAVADASADDACVACDVVVATAVAFAVADDAADAADCSVADGVAADDDRMVIIIITNQKANYSSEAIK